MLKYFLDLNGNNLDSNIALDSSGAIIDNVAAVNGILIDICVNSVLLKRNDVLLYQKV